MKIAFNPSTVAALTTPPNNKDITFDLRGRNIFARGVKFCGTDTNTWRDIKINNVSIGSHTLDLRNGSNTTLTNTNGVVTINSTWRPVVDNLTSNSTTSSLSANQGRVLAGLINGKSDSDHNHDGRYVKKSGDTMLGALNFADGTWNLVGNDSYMGDCNVSGHVGIKAANTTYPGIAFFNNASTYLGNLTAYSGNIKYGAYSLQFLDNGNTSVRVSTWTNPFSAYNSNAVADGQAICVWGQASQLSNLSTDTGDMSLWLKRVNAKAATLNMVLDGEYYAGGNQRLAHVSEIPTSLKNPYALTISLNGTSQGPYDGSAAKNINITPGSIGAATSGHNHDDRYLKLTGGTMFLGEGLKFHSDDNYFGTSADARIISLLDNNDKICDGGLIIDERVTLNGEEYVTELLRIRDSEFKWRGADILHSGNYSGILDSRYYTESEVNNLLSKKLDRVNLSTGNWNPRGYHLAAGYNYNGGDLSISESGGQIHVSVNGYFWQNEGKYRVLDTSDVAGLKNDLTVHQYLSNTDTNWWPLIWGGSSHNNASDSTGAVYKSHDVLSWQTSSQTLYATNIQTENIKHLSIGGGIYWNPNVESASDDSDAASITLVKAGVAGGTTLVLSQMNDANDTIQFKTNTAARLYHNSYPILTTQNTYVSNNKGYINGTEITYVNTAQYLRSLGNQNCQTGRTQNYGDVYSYNTYSNNTGSPTSYTSVIGFGRGIEGTVEIAGGWCNTHLYWRSLRNCCEDWYSWRIVLDSSNYTEFINNYYWANVKISTSSSTTTSPTVHTLTATRVCAGHDPRIDNSISCSNWFRSSGNTGWYNTTYRGGWYMSDTSWIRAHNSVGIYTGGQIYSGSSIRMGSIRLERTNEINSSDNLFINYGSSTNVSLCQGGGKVGIGILTPTQKLDVRGNIITKGFGIQPYYLSKSVLPIINPGDGYTYKCLEIDGTTEISCIIADRAGLMNERGILIKFNKGYDGQIILLKDLQSYGSGNGYFWVMPSGCKIIKADGSSILIGQNQISNIYDDGRSRFLVYSSVYSVWIEFLCSNTT